MIDRMLSNPSWLSTNKPSLSNRFAQSRMHIIIIISLVIIGLTLAVFLGFAKGNEDLPPIINSFAVNSGATFANSTTRTVSATGVFDDLDGTGTLQIQFSQDGVNWGVYPGSGSVNNTSTDWSYSKTVTASPISQNIVGAWYLEGTDGSKIVYVRARDDSDNITNTFSTTFFDDFTATSPSWYNDTSVTTARWSAGHIKLKRSGGSIYVAELGNRVQAFDSTGDFVTKWGTSGSADGQFNWPIYLAIGLNGNVYVADNFNDRIQKFDASGNFITKWGTSGSADGQFNSLYGIALDSADNVYAVDYADNRIQKFDASGNFITKWGTSGSADGQFSGPMGMAVDSSENVYVADYNNNRIQKFDSSGNFITKWGTSGSADGQFDGPSGLAVDNADNVYVADYNNYRIQKFDTSGLFIGKWGAFGASDGQLNRPWAIATDSGNYVYVSDIFNNRIQKFDSSGNFITKWGTSGSADGQFIYPTGVGASQAAQSYVFSNNIAQSKTVDLASTDIQRATLQVTENNDPGTSVNYQLSRDGGQSWEDVTNGVEHNFTSANDEKSDLRWRATLIGSSSATPVIDDITIAYDVGISDSIVLDGTPPAEPGGLGAATTSTSEIGLSWSASDDNGGSGVGGYKVERALDNGGVPAVFTQITDTANIFYSDPSVAANTKYWYRVLAYDNAGNNSSYSLNVSRATLAQALINVIATDGTLLNQVEISWIAPFMGADHYHIYKDSPTGTPIAETTGLTYTDNVLDDDQHTYYIYSVNSEDVENPLYQSDSGFCFMFLPSAPQLTGGQALSSTSIQWNYTDNSDNEDGFKIHDAAHNEIATTPANSSSYTETGGLTPNTTYVRHVHAYNAAGDSSPSANASKTTLASPPTLVSDKWYHSGNQIFVFWNASANANSYRVYRDGSEGVGTLAYSGAGTNFTDILADSSVHTYYIYSVNLEGENSASFISDTSIRVDVPPSPVKIYGSSNDDTFVKRTQIFGSATTYESFPTADSLSVGNIAPSQWKSFLRFPITIVKNIPIDLGSTNLYLRENPNFNSSCAIPWSIWPTEPVLYTSTPMNPGTDSPQSLWSTGTTYQWNTLLSCSNNNAYSSYNLTGAINFNIDDYAYFQIQKPYYTGHVSFASSDFAGMDSDPYLEVKYGPLSPTLMSASITDDDKVRLTFKDNSINEDDYHFYAAASSNPTTETGSSLVSTTKTTNGNIYNVTLSGFAPSNQYYLRIRAHDHTSSEYSNYSNELFLEMQAPELNSLEFNDLGIRANFTDKSAGEDDFHLYGGTSPNPTTETGSPITSTTKTPTGQTYSRDINLAGNTPYYVRLKANNHYYSLFSGYSNELSIISGARPLAAPLVTASASDKLKVQLTGTSVNTPQTRYAIFNATLNKYLQMDGRLGEQAVFIPASNWAILGVENYNLQSDTAYSYRVQSINENNLVSSLGPASAPVRTLADTPIGATAIGTDNGLGGYDVAVHWNSGGAQSKFRVYSSSDNFSGIKYEGPFAGFNETGLNPSSNYDYRIYALNADDVINPSYATATSQKTSLPLMAPSLTSLVTDSEDQISVSFLDNSITEDDFHFYLDTVSPATAEYNPPFSTTSRETVGESSSKSFAPLAANTRYFVKIRAHDHLADNFSTASQELSVYTKALVPLSPIVEAVASDKIKVIIRAEGNPSHTRYAIYNDQLSAYIQANGSVAPGTFYQTISQWGGGAVNTGLAEGSSYSYRVKAKNGDGIETVLGPDSTQVTPGQPPVKPQMFLPTNITSSSITWNWRDNSYNETGFIIHNELEQVIDITAANTTYYTETNLDSDTIYKRHVHAVSNDGESLSSGEEAGRTLLLGPKNLNVEAEPSPSTKANIAWEPPASWAPDHYKVYRFSQRITWDNKDQAQAVGTANQTSFSDTAGADEVWYYQVTAIHQDGRESDLAADVISDVAHISKPSPHGKYSQDTQACANCHRGHTGVAKALMAKNNEQICFTCHDGSGSKYNIAITWADEINPSSVAAHNEKVAPPLSSEVKCARCHDPHGTDKPWALKDNEETLCFTCHTGPMSMNNWDIQAQFQKNSRHAITGTSADGLSGAKVECSSCHGPHTVQAKDGKKLSDPDNTINLWTGNYTDFCLKCHDNGPPLVSLLSTIFVPYTIRFPVTDSNSFFPGWNKAAYKQGGHNEAEIECTKCHNPHGSDNQRLIAFDYDSSVASGTKEEGLCLKCHGAADATSDSYAQGAAGQWGSVSSAGDVDTSQLRVTSDSSGNRDAFIKFNTSALAGKQIDRATLFMNVATRAWDATGIVKILQINDYGDLDSSDLNMPVLAERGSFNTYDGNTLPNFPVSLDVTSMIKQAASGSLAMIALRIDTDYADNNILFNPPSSASQEYRPRIQIMGNKVFNFNAVLDKLNRHPVKDKSDLHADTEKSSGLGEPNRHAECSDCHNPHENKSEPKKTAALAPQAYGAINGAIGVGITNGDPGAPIIFEPKVIDKEYELCFKCHSSNVALPPAKDSLEISDSGIINQQDKAKEFNLNNPSFHPVEATGKNLGIKDETFVEGTPWNPTSGDDVNYNQSSPKIYCTDCHGQADAGLPDGPHGSDNLRLLKDQYLTYSPEICFRCHKSSVYLAYNGVRPQNGDATTYGSRYSHRMAAETNGGCLICHTAHGSTSNKHLITQPFEDITPGEQGMANGGGVIQGCSGISGISCHSALGPGKEPLPYRYEAAYP